jgi:glycosyltransferase involved in cell wall biosynthesis
MKICLVTTFPPSTGGLSEYGFHIAQELQRNPFLSLTVLADELPPDHVEQPGFSVQRCWSFDDPRSVFRLLQTLHRLKPDVVWFNLLFSTFGRNPVIAFSGLMTPLLARLSGRYTHVTLHHLMDTVELKDAGIRHEGLYRLAGTVATRMLLLSNSVSVLMPGYRKILKDKYGRDNVHLRAHGILTRRPEFPDFTRRGAPTHRILAFGKWGTYKRLELMIEAFNLISEQMPDAKLVIAGGDHPQAAGYTESVKQQCAGNDRIEFVGYVPEDALPALFQSASVAVMPYSSSTGCSGVAHLACAYGVPIVCADLADFRQMAQGEELAIEFYPPGDVHGLADCLVQLMRDPAKLRSMATRNFSAGLRMTMPNVVQKYLRHFELQQRVQTLKYVAHIRRLPRWLPSKSLLLRFMTRNSLGWARRSAVLHASWSDRDDLRLLNSNGNARGKLNGAGTALNGDGVAGRLSGRGAATGGRGPGTSGGSGGRGAGGDVPAAGNSSSDHKTQNTSAHEGSDAFLLDFPDDRGTEQPETEQPSGEQGTVRLALVDSGNRGGGDGENGVGASRAGNNGSGRERTGQIGGQAGALQSNSIIEGP